VTTIAYRNGVLASESRISLTSEGGGERYFDSSRKLFRKNGAVIALAGESSPGMLFLKWYGTAKKPPAALIDGEADFTALVLTKEGLFEYDAYCIPEPVEEEFYAIGSGCKAALGAMHMGADAATAVEIAKRVDPGSGGRVVTMALETESAQPAGDAAALGLEPR
jgi:hypothetical protein